MKALKLIFHNIPKVIRWLIVSGCLAPILGFYVVQYLDKQKISFSLNNLIVVLVIILTLLLLGFVVGSLRAVRILLHENENRSSSFLNSAPRKKVLPYSRISLGIFSSEALCVDIQGEIVLGEIVEPSVDIFLKRVGIGDPFCPKCNDPLDIKSAGWMADGAQIGYLCKKCNTEDNRNRSELLADVKGFVRRNFANIWPVYQRKIADMTNNRQDEYCLPS